MQDLPHILTRYFDAANAQDVQAFVGCFSPDAIVKDEGGVHEGHENIATWNRTVNEKYNCKHLVKNCGQTSKGVDVTAEISGTFPGSPIDLIFRFVVQDNKISMLEIR